MFKHVLLLLMSIALTISAVANSAGDNSAHPCDVLTAADFDGDRVSEQVSSIDVEKALPACEEAVKAFPNEPRFLFNLGNAYMSSETSEKAIGYYKKAADAGYPASQYQMGYMYEYGDGATKDLKQAIAWYRKAAEQDQVYALASLGLLYKNGKGVRENSQTAMEWFIRAADLGFDFAQFEVAIFRYNNKWYKSAARDFKKAADQGHTDAQTYMGYIYQNGQGLPRDYVKAMEWYRKAADKNDNYSLFHVAEMYEKGQGVKKDLNEALKWYRKAEAAGNRDASYKISRIAAHVASQIQKKNRANNWPAGVVGEVDSGAVLCTSVKSAIRAQAIENNPYAAQADDCIILPEAKYATKVHHLNGEISKVVLKGAYIEAFTPSHHVIE